MASSDGYKKDWIDAYGEVQKKIAQVPPDDSWRTFVQLREDMNLGSCKMRQVIMELNKAGKIEVMTGSEPDCTGVLKKRVWYRLKK